MKLTAEEAKDWFQGIVIPLATIFKDDCTLDVDTTQSNVQWIVDQGARQGNTVFLAAGSGGDFTVMSTEERKQVIKAVTDVAAGKIPVMAGVQSTDIRVTIELSQFCEEVGVDAVQMSGAYYYDGKAEDVYEWVKEVSRHTGVGFAAYSHWYSGSKYDLPVDLVERMIDEIPNVIAVKWASPSIDNYHRGMLRFVPKAAVVDNSALTLLGHILGCRAWVSHVPNFFPQQSWRVHDLMQQGLYQEAQRVHEEFDGPYSQLSGEIMGATAGEGIFVKPWMEVAGLPGGHSRLPSRDAAVTPAIRARIRQHLERAREAVATAAAD